MAVHSRTKKAALPNSGAMAMQGFGGRKAPAVARAVQQGLYQPVVILLQNSLPYIVFFVYLCTLNVLKNINKNIPLCQNSFYWAMRQ
jgi:hypothetical protein